MDHPTRESRDGDPLAADLRTEAAASRPAFSHALHARIMAAVQPPATSELSPRRNPGSPALGRRLALAAVSGALILLIGWIALRQIPTESSDNPHGVAKRCIQALRVPEFAVPQALHVEVRGFSVQPYSPRRPLAAETGEPTRDRQDRLSIQDDQIAFALAKW